MKLRFKKLEPKAQQPLKATLGACAFDLTSISIEYLDTEYLKYHTGIAVEIPKGYVGLLFPRSSVYKTKMVLANSVGVIDSDYRGEICALFHRTDESIPYEIGERCCQLTIMPVADCIMEEVADLSNTERAEGGFGSTGK